MSVSLRRQALWAVRGLLQPLRVFPWFSRHFLLRLGLFVESRLGSPRSSLKRLFALADDLDRLIAERATAYGEGTNPKHRLTGYHDFFVARIAPGSRVLDIGSGIGVLARSIADRVPGSIVVAMDVNPEILRQARLRPLRGNLTFVEADASQNIPQGPWNVVVLSNVLEHIANRVLFLKMVLDKAQPERFLLRVPLFERHWHMPLRREVGADYRSDPTHTIEHTIAEFEGEMKAAGLRLVERITLWGEIWAHAEPMA